MVPPPADGDQTKIVGDPSVRTTDLLRREIAAARELTEAKFNAAEQSRNTIMATITARLNSVDKVLERLRTEVDKSPANIHDSVEALQKLLEVRLAGLRTWCEEKFDSIQTQFRERDTRNQQIQNDAKVWFESALSVSKEAGGKSEASTTKQIDQIGASISALGKTLDDKVADMKDRITAIESRAGGSKESLSSAGAVFLGFVSMLSALAGVAAVIITITRRG